MLKSDTINELAAALAKAQKVMGVAKKDSENPFFKSKYSDLASVVDAIKNPLADNGLSYVQATDIDEHGGVIVETTLMHSSGQWIESRLRMTPTKPDPQGIGSCITYARRYGLQALVGVPSDDDDGNAASCEPQRKENGILPGTGVHKPTGGVFEKLPPDKKNRVLDFVAQINDWIAQDSVGDAYVVYDNVTDNDERVALFDKLDSKVRSALKKEKIRIEAKELVMQP